MADKIEVLNELKDRIMANTRIQDQEEALEIARKWMNS